MHSQQSLYIQIHELQIYEEVFKGFIRESQNVQGQGDTLKANVEEMLRWQEEFTGKPDIPPVLSDSEKQISFVACEKCRDRDDALFEKVSRMLRIFNSMKETIAEIQIENALPPMPEGDDITCECSIDQ